MRLSGPWLPRSDRCGFFSVLASGIEILAKFFFVAFVGSAAKWLPYPREDWRRAAHATSPALPRRVRAEGSSKSTERHKSNMARRGSTDYNKWASFDDEDDDPLAKLTIGNERRHPSLPKVVRKRPEPPRPASKGRKAPTEPAALPKELPTVKSNVAPELAPLKAKYSVELLCDPN